MPHLKQQITGLLADFWKDPVVGYPTLELKLAKFKLKIPNLLKPSASERKEAPPEPTPVRTMQPAVAASVAQTAPAAPSAPKQKWDAFPGEVAEKMWGEGQIYPAGDVLVDKMVAPLNLTKDKFVLDLTAGLGGPLRHLVGRVQTLKGMETDPNIATRGMEMSTKAGKGKLAPVEFYDPASFSMPAIYDAMISRELFFRIPDKGRFFYSIAAGIKLNGQAAFTDYIVNPEVKDQPSIVAWKAHEMVARPLGLIEMAEEWAKVGFEIRSSEDLTDFYRKEIVAGINRLVAALKNGGAPGAETKKTILREVELWVHRLAAIQQGMKFYRFHAKKT